MNDKIISCILIIFTAIILLNIIWSIEYKSDIINNTSIANNKCDQKWKILFECANDYIKNICDDWYYITSTELKNNINDYYIIDIRAKNDYIKYHIPNSINIPCNRIIDYDVIKNLPNNKIILIVCYVGHSASQLMVLLRLLGYNVRTLKFGMGVPSSTNEIVAGWMNYKYDSITNEKLN